jgi:hypothetical protein
MIKRMTVGFMICFCLGVPVSRAATTYYVATNGLGQGTNGWADATNNLQGAIDAIESGSANTVWVSNGVYEVGGVTNYPSGSLQTNRVAIWKAITVRSANNDPTNTIIKGAWDPATTNGPAAVVCVWMTDGATLIGFTLSSGAIAGYDDYSAGGVRAALSSSAIISNCVIVSNSGNYGGGIINCTLYNSTLKRNVASRGGGAYNANLYNCLVISNYTVGPVSSSPNGGGVWKCTLRNCTLVGNQAYNGGGSWRGTLYNCKLIGNYGTSGGGGALGGTLINCTVVGNQAYGGGGANGEYETCVLSNSIVYFNNSGQVGNSNYSGTTLLSISNNNCTSPSQAGWPPSTITNDPLFIDKGSGTPGLSYVAGNLRLANNSPCINTGTNQDWMTTTWPYDLDWRARIRYGRVDMGAYETIYNGTIFMIP